MMRAISPTTTRRTIKRVRRDGFDVRPEHQAELSPYRTGHINLPGRYLFSG